MTAYYVDSAATGSATGADWTNAFTTVQAGLTAASAGDTIYVASSHDERAAATLTLTPPSGTKGNPVRVISADKTTGTPPTTYTRGAKVGSSTGGYHVYVTGNGYGFLAIGVEFHMGWNFGNTGATQIAHTFVDCGFTFINDGPNQGAVYTLTQGSSASFIGCDFTFGRTTHGNQISGYDGKFFFRDCSATVTTGFITNIGEGGLIVAENIDLSGAGANCKLISDTGTGSTSRVYASGVSLPSGGSIASHSFTSPHGFIDARHVGIGGAFYGVHYIDRTGTVVEDTSIYRNATYDGTNGYSLQFNASADAIAGADGWVLRYPISEFWAAANPTIKVSAFGDHSAEVKDNAFWIEVEYPDSTNKALRKIATSKHADLLLGTPASVTQTGTAGEWTGETSVNTQYFFNPSLTVSGGAAGVHRAFVCYASTQDLFVDPAVDIT